MLNSEKTMESIVSLCKGRGFVFPGSEIYGGLSNTWDYGPLGVEFKEYRRQRQMCIRDRYMGLRPARCRI